MRKRFGLVGVCALLLTVGAAAQTTVTTSGGTANSIPVFTGTTAVGNSVITQSNGNVGIGTAAPAAVLQVVNPVNANGQVGFQVNQATGGNLDLTAVRVQSSDDGNYIRFLHKATSWGAGDYIDANGVFNVKYDGNVGIGTTSPGTRLEVDGNIKLTSGSGASITYADGTVQSTAWTGSLCGGDYAESVDVSGKRKQYGPGDVLVIDPVHPGNFLKSTKPYSRLVAGIYSTKPGLVGRRQTTTDPKLRAEEVPMAMVGIVPTKVTAEDGPIEVGDLMVTSSKPGYAMKGKDGLMKTGTVIGKALGSLSFGTGVIEVLVSLQ